jgi:nucleotide-binding universal stress UspA family protein
MTFATLMVYVQSGQSNVATLAAAGQFADRFKSHIIGVAACQPMMVVSGDGYVCGDVYENDQRQITDDLKAAEVEFRDGLRGRSTWLEWRSSITIAAVADYLAVEARCADLIITGSVAADVFDLERTANPGLLAMQAGRPVLVVPKERKALKFDHAVIGWKDTRESRRAAIDALPLLKEFAHVTVAEIADADDGDDLDATKARVTDVVTWLARHGVMAEARVERSTGDDAGQLHRMMDDAGADLIVAGAYGHSRLREWVMGGVTRNLLLDSKHHVFVSH